MNCSCIILAGGEAKRLPDKPFFLFSGKPLILHVIEKAERVFDEIVIVVKNEEQKEKMSKLIKNKIAIDNNKIFSPIAGIKEGIRHIKNDFFFLLACDMPHIDEKIILDMTSMINYEIDCIAAFSRGIEPFFSVYKKNIFFNAKENDSLQSMIRKSKSAFIEIENKEVFFNINELNNISPPHKVPPA